MSAFSKHVKLGIFSLILFVLATPINGQTDSKTATKSKQTKKFVSQAGGFEIEHHDFKERVLRPKSENGEKLEIRLFQANSADKKFTWIVSYHDLPKKPVGAEEIKKVLDRSIVGAVDSVEGFGIAHKTIRLQKHPGRYLEYGATRSGQEIRGTSHIFIRDGRLYFVVYSTTKEKFDKEQANAFLKTFRFIEIKKPKGQNTTPKGAKKSKTLPSRP